MALSDASTNEIESPNGENVANPPSLTNEDITDAPIESKYRSGWDLAKSLIGAAAGNFLEWFDFALFGLLAEEIGENFFPKSKGKGVALLESFGVFAGAFFMRPIGGALFGYIGDKFSRLTALRLSIFMMAFPTFITGILPTYHSIGIASTIILVLLRLIQGLSVGGELTGALVYVLEVCPQNRRALFATLVQISGSGTVLGSAVVAILRGVFTKEQMLSYAWRLPFLFGLVVALFGFWMRKGLHESSEHEHYKNKRNEQNSDDIKNPLWTTIKTKKLTILAIVLHTSLAASSYYAVFIWLPTYLQNIREPPINFAYTTNMVSLICSMGTAIFTAWLADLYTPTKIILIFGPIYLIIILILLPLLKSSKPIGIPFIQLGLGMFQGLYFGPVSVWSIDMLTDTITRYSGMGLGYNISLAIFGGTAPFIATAVVEYNSINAYSWVMFSIGFIAISNDAIVSYIKRNKNKYSFKNNDNNNDIQMISSNNNNNQKMDPIL